MDNNDFNTNNNFNNENPNNQYTNPNVYYYNQSQYRPPVKEKKKTSFATIFISSIMALILGFVGSGLYSFAFSGDGLFSNSSNLPVIYQAVERTDEDGNKLEDGDLSISDVAKLTSDSVVEITTQSEATNFFNQKYTTQGAGSGVIITEDGYIITNYHVIDGANAANIRLKDGTEYSVRLVGTDQNKDLALLKIDAEGLTSAVYGNYNEVKVGDSAIVIGNPLGELGGTVTEGIISSLDREILVDGQSMQLIQTNAQINPGNSGGGMFNINGELIGVVVAKSSALEIEGIGFAIPIDIVKDSIENMIRNDASKNKR